ncbi:MAG: DUF2306 domain-containing protein [Pseudomonadota bacterium]
MLVVHIAAGSIALLSGAIAMAARKGGRLHRRSGTVFVYAMLVMCVAAIALAVMKPEPLSAVVGALTFYLVVTSLFAVRSPAPGKRWPDVVAFALGLGVVATMLLLGVRAAGHAGSGGADAAEAAAGFFVFGAVGVVAVLLDLRMLIAGGIRSAHHRLARHLWRMCFALFLSTTSLFFGQADIFPEPVRQMKYLSIPVLTVFLLMLFWLGRVLLLKRYRRPLPTP